VKSVAKQPCLVCGRRPADAHHLRFVQSRALSRKVSDEFTVPLCRGHHREVHRSGDEAAWWKKMARFRYAADIIARSIALVMKLHNARAAAVGSAGSASTLLSIVNSSPTLRLNARL
jgi:hypothetical protein